MTDSARHNHLLYAVRKIDPAVLCRFYRDNKIAIDILIRLVYSTVLTTLFFTTIAVTTTITAFRLRRVVQWRQSSTSSASVAATSSIKEIVLTKTLVATSVLFILCLAPMIMFQIASFVEPEFYFTGRYYNLAYLLTNVMVFFQAYNSSFNFFIYYNMSTRYRETLRDIFRLCVRKRKESEGGDVTETTEYNK